MQGRALIRARGPFLCYYRSMANPLEGSAVGAASALARLLQPAQYLALVLLFGGLMFYLDRREERRDERLLPIITACLKPG